MHDVQSGIHGWGLFARRPIKPDTMIIEYRGERVRRTVADARERRYRAAGKDCYLFNVDDEIVVDATRRGTIGRFTVSPWDAACFCERTSAAAGLMLPSGGSGRAPRGARLSCCSDTDCWELGRCHAAVYGCGSVAENAWLISIRVEEQAALG